MNFSKGYKVLVAGSTWEPDETELVHYIRSNHDKRFILAPHEIHTAHLSNLLKRFEGQSQLMSSVRDQGLNPGVNLIIVDNIGMLSKLYRLADITYIGGGFGADGIHNVLEAAVYGKPVIFGPEHEKFAEAVTLIEQGGAFTVENAIDLEKILENLFNDSELLNRSSKTSKDFVYGNRGATSMILNYIQANRLLIS